MGKKFARGMAERGNPMTEQEWMACTNTRPMLEFLRHTASPRKLCLFACACCRRIWHLITDEASRQRVELTERYVAGLADRAEWVDARLTGPTPSERTSMSWGVAEAVSDTYWAASNGETEGGTWVAVHEVSWKAEYAARERERFHEILRDLFGNPFRPPPPVERAWLAWNGGTVVALAQAMYEGPDFSRAPLLADMLEDAGCTDATILDHLRGPGPHVRGCFVVDLLLDQD
jgi:hypothetical protein